MKQKVCLLYKGSIDGFTDSDSIALWQAVSAAKRLEETWRLAEEIWLLKGKKKNELRLQRSVALVKRKKN